MSGYRWVPRTQSSRGEDKVAVLRFPGPMSDDAARRWDPWRTVTVRTADGGTTAVHVWLPPLPPPAVVVPEQSTDRARQDARLTTR